jgi:hypothetical protein
LVADVSAEHDVHARQACQFRRLIDLVGALRALVDFLQRHKIRLHRLDHTSDAREIESAICPFAVVDVVAQHSQPQSPADHFWRTVFGSHVCRA